MRVWTAAGFRSGVLAVARNSEAGTRIPASVTLHERSAV
jgi:hypothetical protein